MMFEHVTQSIDKLFIKMVHFILERDQHMLKTRASTVCIAGE